MIDITIERLLIWAYRDQRALELASASVGFGTGLRSSMAAFDGLIGLGVVIRSNACHASPPDAAPDAMAAHAAALAIDEPLVINHARLGSRPEDMSQARPRLYPLRDDSGAPIVQYFNAAGELVEKPRGGKTRKLLSQVCPVRARPTAGEIAARQAEYHRWIEGLFAIHELLAAPGALTSHRLIKFEDFRRQTTISSDQREPKHNIW